MTCNVKLDRLRGVAERRYTYKLGIKNELSESFTLVYCSELNRSEITDLATHQ